MGHTRAIALAALLTAALVVAGCGGSDGGPGTTTSTEAPASTSTVVPASTSTSTTTTIAGDGASTSSSPVNTLPVLVPGQPCAPGSDPDCIDPEGTGDYVYLLGGAACMAGPLGGPSCIDLDGDGYAGYPDRG